MKKVLVITALICSVLFSLQSCKKEDFRKNKKEITISQTINVAIDQKKTYTFTLPANTSDDEFQITVQALHYSLSELGRDADGNLIYQYTPATGYAGTDRVVIATAEEQHHNCANSHSGHNGSCGNNSYHSCGQNNSSEQDMIITINFTVKAQG